MEVVLHLKPFYRMVHVDFWDGGRIGVGVVGSQFSKKLTVSFSTAVCRYNPEKKGFSFFVSLQSNFYWHSN